MASTPRLALPFLSVGQAQKEFTHNESLQTLDVLVGGCVEGPPKPAPPPSPAIGRTFLVASGASGEWAGKDNQLAAWTSGGWRFVVPQEGMQLYERSSGTWAIYKSGGWHIGVVPALSLEVGGVQVVGARGSAVAQPSGGTVIDSQSRTAINAILAALRGHGLIES